MKKFFKTKMGKITAAILPLLLIAAIAFGGYELWLYRQLKFQDVTIELGATTLDISQFTTQYAQLKKCSFASDLSAVNLGKVGEYPLTLTHGYQQEQVTLTIQDTTAPKAVFHTELVKSIGYVPKAVDFVESFSDYSETTVVFAKEPVLSEACEDVTVTVIVRDAEGNETKQDCLLRTEWIHTSLTLELGQPLTKAQILLNPEKDADLIDQTEIDKANRQGVGEYTIFSSIPGKTMQCIVTVQDTQGPELTLKALTIYPKRKVGVKQFVESCTDASGQVELTLLTEIDNKTLGHHTVQVAAKDASGNITVGETTLIVTTDLLAPTLSGLTDLSVAKYSKPDFLAGVTAQDNVDENCQITVDETMVDVSKAGTYYLTYTATDTSGNETVKRRKITVEHDEEDTKLLIAEIAAQLENNPEKLSKYVRGKIGYSRQWGGDDPVWYGFKNRTGNCYVHALCLDALLKYYGYETKLIWVTNETHYWLLVNLEGIGWRHIDPTPSRLHSRYSLMTDAQRKSTLSGRTWDTTLWPAAVELSKRTAIHIKPKVMSDICLQIF